VPGQSDIDTYVSTIGAINPVINSLLGSKPWGTLPATGGNATFTTPFLNNSDNVIAKVDQHLKLFSPGDLLTGRYYYSHGMQSFPLGMLYTGSSAPGFNTSTPRTSISFRSRNFDSETESDRRGARRLQPIPAAVSGPRTSASIRTPRTA